MPSNGLFSYTYLMVLVVGGGVYCLLLLYYSLEGPPKISGESPEGPQYGDPGARLGGDRG